MFKKLQIESQQTYSIAKGVAIVSAFFAFVVCILLITNYLQTKAVDPINNTALSTLLNQLEKDQQNETLREQIRAVDLLSRKAYFVNQWQLKTGAYLLLGSVVLLLIALRIIHDFKAELPLPEGELDKSEAWIMSSKARQYVVGMGVFLLGTAFIFALLSYNELKDANADDVAFNLPTQEDFQNNWANFRGYQGIGVANVEKAPTFWDVESGQNIKWKSAIPLPGFNSPIIWEDKIFISGGANAQLAVFCYNAETGALLWQQQVTDQNDESLKGLRVDRDTGITAPTMATNGRYVFAIFANGKLVSYDFEGNLVWSQNLGKPDNHYGHSSSLLIYENTLYVQLDQNSNSRLLALDVMSGNTVWRVNRNKISWSSPICVNTGSRMELILTNTSSVDSYDPKTGVKYWTIDCLEGEHGPSPAYNNGLLFVANEYSQGTALKISENSAEPLWEYYDELPDGSSPVATDEYIFMATGYGSFVCLDIKTGDELWLQEFDAGFYASPILVNNTIYALDKKGSMHIFEAANEFKSINDCVLNEKTFSTPAFVGNRIYIRGDKNLYCVETLE